MKVTPTDSDISLCITLLEQIYNLADYSNIDLANLLNLEFPDYHFTDTDVYRHYNTTEMVELEESDSKLIYKNMGL